MDWKVWLKGLVSGMIASAASAITVVVIDPQTFNLFEGGAQKLGALMLVNAIVAAGMYLKKSPLPDVKG